ncbi:MAG: helix-hairpin-helix domain-containing protein, partial [bacterium]|nr:helix-hairpin-helix domain-containing protein [bacterium]
MLLLSRATTILLFASLLPISIWAADPCIDINIAPKEELEKIKQIGESRAEQIIKLRGEKPFLSVDELSRVTGLGAVRVSDIKKQGLACVKTQETGPARHASQGDAG